MMDARVLSPLENVFSIYNITGVAILIILCRQFLTRPRTYKVFPVWATVEIAIASYILHGHGLGRRLYASIRRYSGSLFGVALTHQILVDYPGLERLMSQPFHTLTAEPVQYTIFTRVFGGKDSPQLKKKLEHTWKDVLAPIERLFLNDAAVAAAVERANVPMQASSLVSFTNSRTHMKRWELSANIQLVEPHSLGQPRQVEANFQSLIRDFGACMAIPLLYGRGFLEQNPTLLDDFWKFDNDLFPMLMIGLPIWTPIKMIREGRAARARILAQLESLYRNIDKCQNGEPVSPGINMSDVNPALFDRNTVYRREGWTFEERAAGDFAVFWGQNANTHPLLFWLLTYVYSTPGLLDRVRAEISPYFETEHTESSGPSIKSMDIPALTTTCPILKACIYETYRMTNEPTSIRYLAREVTLTDGDRKHTLQPGTFVSAPQSLINHDPSIFENPSEFIPDRFLEVDPHTGKQVARYGRLRPWGVGASMCKGRTFAEKEIVALGAAVMRLWDVKPVDAHGDRGNWDIPAMIPGTGVKRPVRDLRVLISRVAV